MFYRLFRFPVALPTLPGHAKRDAIVYRCYRFFWVAFHSSISQYHHQHFLPTVSTNDLLPLLYLLLQFSKLTNFNLTLQTLRSLSPMLAFALVLQGSLLKQISWTNCCFFLHFRQLLRIHLCSCLSCTQRKDKPRADRWVAPIAEKNRDERKHLVILLNPVFNFRYNLVLIRSSCQCRSTKQ